MPALRSPATRSAIGAALALGLFALPAARAEDPLRDESPVLVSGASLSEFTGDPVGRLAVFRWNDAAAAFEPIPFQLDQRVDEVFNPGTLEAFTMTMYDVLGRDDGLLDGNDEVVFLFGDAGPRAPGDAPWVPAAEDTRAEVQITNALPGKPSATRWAYVFEGDALPRSDVAYVAWNGRADSPVVTTAFSVDYEGPWLLTGLTIAPPCGSGRDLIDRVKGRAVTSSSAQEDEEIWNASSSFLGGSVGPIRAIRYVRGAASGVNTIHLDLIYRARWRREVDLRIHPLQSASLYIDWLPLPGGRFFSPAVSSGVWVDGVPDAVPSDYVPWTVTTSLDGGIAIVHEVASSPLYQSRMGVYRDDAAYDDRIPRNPGYSDDDDAAYGDSGVEITGISDTGVQAITLWSVASVLCGGVGDASTGTAYRQFFDNPLQVAAVSQERGSGAISTLACARDAADVVLAWQAVPGAATYRVFASGLPSTPQDAWTLLGETAGLTWRDPGAVSTPSVFYSVVSTDPNGEGAR